MIKTAVKTNEVDDVIVERAPPKLKSMHFRWQGGLDGRFGQVFRWAVVRLPEGMELKDRHEHPEVWSTLQDNPKCSLRALDFVTSLPFDESWMIRQAVVAHADRCRVVLAFEPKDKIRLDRHTSDTWEDDRVKIRWDGPNLYCV